ncbi:MAG: hypothetical protein RQ757_06660 [Pseudomonadales bacterium]|nr:hypothetical protein [Pseudomonadales bacterium]
MRIRMQTRYPSCAALLALAMLYPLASTAQESTAQQSKAQDEQYDLVRTVHIFDEPRHRTVHVDGDIRVLDVQINPGDTTLPHTHDAAIMYTFISNGDGPLYGRLSSVTEYASEPLTHRVNNAGPELFRIIALVNQGPPLADSNDRPAIAEEPALENPWFRSYRIELAPGQSTALRAHLNPGLIVQVAEGLVHVSREDGITAELNAMGDWAWRDAGSAFKVSNVGNTAVAVVINEARRQPQ